MSVLASEFQGGARPRLAAFGLDVAFTAGVEILTSSPNVGTLDWLGPLTNVRFTPKSGHRNSAAQCPLCAKSGREQVQQKSAMKAGLFDHFVGASEDC